MTFKTILLGESGVGKTSLFIRLTSGFFNERVQASLQMDIGRKVYHVSSEQIREFTSKNALLNDQSET